MATWADVERDAPELAAKVRERLQSHRHCLLATLRADGSPRLSGIEVQFALGELWMGMMGGSVKAADLRRDGRMALHSAPDEPEIPGGDAKLAGRADEVSDPATIAAWAASLGNEPPEPFHLFRVDIGDLSHLKAAGDHLVIEWWQEGRGYRTMNRR
ncbi:MAG: pyridoxamine 5-phosphate oxidase [Acidimicrobiales bacterium]|nr:pyridoxamine 5-phosphate oxidase [Acidimicrobiales bacterium]